MYICRDTTVSSPEGEVVSPSPPTATQSEETGGKSVTTTSSDHDDEKQDRDAMHSVSYHHC